MSQDEPAEFADEQWTWDRSAGYLPLARFASVTALQGLALLEREAYQALAATASQPGADIREAVREATKRLYEHLRSRRYPYAAPLAYYDGKQRIRDPVAIHQDSGTCLDLSLMFAAMCTAAGLRSFVTILEGGDEGDHALVLVDLASTPPGIGRPGQQGISGFDAPISPQGHTEVTGVQRLVPGSDPVTLTEDGIAIEVTAACGDPGYGFEHACRLGAMKVADRGYRTVHFVDILTCRAEVGEAPPPKYRPAIYPSLPPMPAFTAYPSRAAIAERLRGATGAVVILGDSGTGKSMLAHHVAATVDHGCGWFLDASSERALTVALAAEEARAKGRPSRSIDSQELGLLARQSLDRLAKSAGRWAVVLDNANGDPASLKSLPTPAAGRGQLLIITTINPAWDDGQHEVIRLPGLPPGEVAREIAAAGAPVEAIAGRPLLIEASRRFSEATGRWWWAAHPGSAESAPASFWAAVTEELGDGLGRTVAHAISWLPPVRLPVAALVSAIGTEQARAAVAWLRQLGLVDLEAGQVTMHRLFRSAVRDSVLRDGGSAQVELISLLLRDGAVRHVMEYAADLDTARQMGELLDEASGQGGSVAALYELATVFERHGTAADSAVWYARFRQRAGSLPGGEAPDELRLRVANALFGMARATMRGLAGPPDERVRSLDEAIGWTAEAEALCAGHSGDGYRKAASRAKAMRGLLLRKRAGLEPDGSASGLDFLRQAELALRQSYDERVSQFEQLEASPDLDRSQYNLAGLEVRLAQRDDPANAARHLDQAWRHYTGILEARRRRYRTDELEEVVCCINGQAIVAYYQAVLIPGTWAEKTALLRKASERAGEAVAIRQRLAGPADDLNTSKSLNLQAKIALARLAVTEAAGTRADRDQAAIDAFCRERRALTGLTGAMRAQP